MSGKVTRKIPLLFGHEARNRVLVSLAVRGPSPKRALAAALRIGRSVVYLVLQHYLRIGVIKSVGKHGREAALASWFAAPELEALLYRLGGARRTARLKRTDRTPRHIGDLFGGENRSNILMLLASIGPTPTPILARLAGLTNASARNAVSHLAREHIIRTDAGVVSLDPTFKAAPELRRLLDQMATHLMNRRKVSDRRDQLLAVRASKPRRRSHASTKRALPFGTPRQAALLLQIAKVEIATISELAAMLNWSASQVSGVAQSLERHWLVVSKIMGSSRKRRRWLALDPRHPLRAHLQLFANPTGAITKRTRLLADSGLLAGTIYRPGEIPACLPGDEVPNNLLIALARRRGLATDQQLSRDVGQARRYISKWLSLLDQQQFIRLRKTRDGVAAHLNPRIMHGQAWILLQATSTFLETHGGNGQHQCERDSAKSKS